ncbi:fumarate reductase/succinate dehydrogenase flavoprotein subunit [Ornithobacterium rhinotracheale]|uniref:succinate dehydrogenase n=1 Tax=Ornithobacterium rhinotracheale (strain ATCC 51463 / DSM 15997 / CCUG 23171 / CIP 104009 / LMG 9086) TaxID=867902 RepID=I4A0K2_ORNRL|nr:fumarate reductase/succinate dehydrogenase flavoprotein subunit [Ornithobacterium rhinotracheale]AFL97486.1 menaquinone-dependent succinate dehydrogenase/fumarate reductase, flavoprotein subunit [Ornithobacterium rhinotracheale DSM 15997]AIP98974.1 succinate dehydrogenase [Ornithobacterium rhinotracheale ORT-UMN 88]KGB66911.1 succinate dehydrogenase [Ornithobacterium rhinotracheale H06-030791]MBN3661950.1 fumarate reductase/succinate dehydrogenase flavoprotein subunit [Ornithobacterium rhino
MNNILDAKVPQGDIAQKWANHKQNIRLVAPNNRDRIDVIVIGTGLAGGSAAATLAEQGYNVKAFCYQDSPRRAHSIAAQGGINAAKNYQGDNDSIYRLFYDTVKGGDYRAREANVYRLAEESVNIIDQCVMQGVPFARDYGGLLDNRSFGGVQVKRTFYAKGQTGQQLLLGAYSAMNRQINLGRIKMYNRHEMLDLVIVNGKARGIIARNLVTGEIERHSGHAVVIASGGYGNVYFLSTNAMGSNATACWKIHKKGAFFGNPCYVQIHPTCIPVHGTNQSKLTLMSESLRNSGRIWVPKKKEDAEAIRLGKKKPVEIKEEDRDYYLERRYPAFGNLVPRDVASRAAKERCDAGFGIENNDTKEGVFLDFSTEIQKKGKESAYAKGNHNPTPEEITKLGKKWVEEKYGNLFQMYEKITDDNPYETPMKIYPAVHYTMGGIWVDYNLMSTIPGCYVIGEANFSDHGANRLGASALMQGLADGYFVLPYTIADYLADDIRTGAIPTDTPEFDKAEAEVKERINYFINNKGTKSVDHFHKRLGMIMWNKVGMARNEKGLKEAITEIQALRKEFYRDVFVPGEADDLNPELEKALRVSDFMELGELMAMDALDRNESCGGHFREEYQTEEGEALRDDVNYTYVSVWEYKGEDISKEVLHKEKLEFNYIELKQRSYK